MDNSTSNNATQLEDLNWPPGIMIPAAEASIFLCFHGLMCLAYNSDCRRLEAGMHSKAPKHRFRIDVFGFGRDLTAPRPVYSFTPDSYDIPGGVVGVDISTPKDPGVGFYLPNPEDDLSWAQLLDLEGPEFYKRKLKKNQILKPRIHINHGQFCTYPTRKNFLRREEIGSGSVDIGPIVYLGLGMVRHEGAGTIRIATADQELILPASADRPLLVLFSNACPKDECDEDANDFPLYYKAIKLKGGEKKYRLEPKAQLNSNAGVSGLSFFEHLFRHRLLDEIFSNQDAPCGAAGYGRSNGLDDSASS